MSKMKQHDSFFLRSAWFLRAMFLIAVSSAIVVITAIPMVVLSYVLPKRPLAILWERMGSYVVLTISGVDLQIEAHDEVGDGVARFYVGNHQSLLDILILATANNGDLRFMAKDSLFRVPFFGWIISHYDFVRVNRSSPRKAHESLTRMIEQLKRNPLPFVVFPEGTRSVDDHLLPFKAGALKIVQRTGLPIVPFAIFGANKVIRRGRWGVTPGKVKLAFCKTISAEEAASMTSQELCERVRKAVETEFDRLAKSF